MQQDMPARPRPREPIFNLAGVIVGLIALCAGIHVVRAYLLTPGLDLGLIARAAFIPARYSGQFDLDIYALVSPLTYSLLHGDFVHLIINMIWLAAFGSPLARRIGTWRFLVFWCVCSVAAAAAFYVVHADEFIPVIGASGAVSGMMAAAARFGFAIDRTTHAFAGPVLTPRQMAARINVLGFLGVWMVINLIAGFGLLVPGGPATIAWEAHVGGFLAGLLGIRLFVR